MIAEMTASVAAPPRNFLEGLRYCRNPFLVMHHFQHVKLRRAFIAEVTGISEDEVGLAIEEVETDQEFLTEVVRNWQHFRGMTARGADFMYLIDTGMTQFYPFVMHYALVRILRPSIVVETGGTPGTSSAFMLRAVQRNGLGRITTLDLPALREMGEVHTSSEVEWYQMMPDSHPPGWMVPDSLRPLQEQVLGDARVNLPKVFETYPQVDIFIHDSDHSYEHMMFEFETAWPHIRPGGLLVSDDIRINQAFSDFREKIGQPSHEYVNYGVIKKPAASTTS